MSGDSGRLWAEWAGVWASAPSVAATPARVRDLIKSLRCMAWLLEGAGKRDCGQTYFGWERGVKQGWRMHDKGAPRVEAPLFQSPCYVCRRCGCIGLSTCGRH